MDPLRLARRLRYEVGRRRPRSYPYRDRLLELFCDFVTDTYGDAALDHEAFKSLANRYLGLTTGSFTRQVARYVNDLWDLFTPDYHDRLPDLYAATEHLRTMRSIDYASEPQLIEQLYVAPYRYAIERLGRVDVLEVGPCIPHGLIRTLDEQPQSIASFTANEIDGIYTRFALWLCSRHGVAAEWIPAVAGTATQLPAERFDLVVAKDVLEHLHDPAAMVTAIVASAKPHAVLVLDLADKGDVRYEHVSPRLSGLAALLSGWEEQEAFGHLRAFVR